MELVAGTEGTSRLSPQTRPVPRAPAMGAPSLSGWVSTTGPHGERPGPAPPACRRVTAWLTRVPAEGDPRRRDLCSTDTFLTKG